jgi:MFS family permease
MPDRPYGAGMTQDAKEATTEGEKHDLRVIVAASAAGTTFEWYDFFIFGALTTIISKNFFTGLSDTAGSLLALLTFALGFIARPVGALVFGHIGDRKGRKGTFLYTILIMGVATVAIGFLPTYSQAGIIAPLLLVALRIVQGFALGGEYGGAAIYVAEHAPQKKRGAYTGWIQTSAAFGLMAALITILITRTIVGEPAFVSWGWRIPFIVSTGLLIVSVYIRAKTAESPSFLALHAQAATSKAPFRESFAKWGNLRKVLIALFGFMTAQGVLWYTNFFYTQIYLEKTVKLDPALINYLILGMTLVSAFLYITFASLSDRIGRKPVLLGGIILSCVTLFPGFHMMLSFGNPALAQAIEKTPVTISAGTHCSFQFDPVGKAQARSACDLAKGVVTNLGVPYVNGPEVLDRPTTITIGDTQIGVGSGAEADFDKIIISKPDLTKQVKEALAKAGYPLKADPAKANLWGIFAVLCVFAVAATALYGPMASLLVEMFPTKVRYTALSLPYNIGTGWFGGLLPAISFAMVAASGNIYFGLWYPVVTAMIAVIVSLLFLKETSGRSLDDIEEVDG